MSTAANDPDIIYLEPYPGSPEGRMWCEDPVWDEIPECEGQSVPYVRGDLVREALSLLEGVEGANERLRRWRAGREFEQPIDGAITSLTAAAHAMRALKKALSATGDPDA